ncbi:non-ribosomal peptide synthetase, partial [Nocardia rhamnosiphila]
GLVEDMLAAYHGVLTRLGAADWEQPLDSALPVLPAHQRAIRHDVNDTTWPHPPCEVRSGGDPGRSAEAPRLLHSAMFDIAEADPGRVALVDRDATVSFGALAEQSRRIAGLLAAHGVRPGDAVAVSAVRGAAQVAALYGVLAAGAAYVPVAVDQPVQRRTAILEQAGVVAVLTDDTARFAAGHLDDAGSSAGPELTGTSCSRTEPVADPHALAEVGVAVGVRDVIDTAGNAGLGDIAAVSGAADPQGVAQVAGAARCDDGTEEFVSGGGVLVGRAVHNGGSVEEYPRGGRTYGSRAPIVAIADARDCAPAPVYRGSGSDLAYVIFTSGSTGIPKGVEIEHAQAVNTLADLEERYGLGARDRVLAVAAVDFDLSVFDLFGVLGAGGSAVIVPDEDRRDPGRWLALVREHGVTVWNTVPAMLDMLLTVAESGPLPLPSLRLVLVSGDWVGPDLPGRLTARSGSCRFIALGGATEAAIWSNYFEVDSVDPAWTSIPYGRPLRNQRFRVVDEDGRDRPDWVPGELLIGGAGVARGYRGRPDLTAAAFFADDGTRWYRTGDLGRYRPDGVLEFLGRADRQVKIRGHRVELGEIEQAVTAHPHVRRAIALAVGERANARLVTFVEPEAPTGSADAGPAPEELPGDLAAFLADRIPAGWMPELIRMVDPPLTGNGKVDHAALVRRAESATPAARTGPGEPIRPGLETRMAQIWADTVGAAPIDRQTSFFAAGGDSLSATRLVGRLGRELGVAVTLREFFTTPTIAGLGDNQPQADIDLEEGAL